MNTGEVVAGDVSVGQRLVTGDGEHCGTPRAEYPDVGGAPGEAPYRLVKDAVVAEPVEPLELKGKSKLTPAYRLISVRRHEEGVARRLDAPMIGREERWRP